MRFTSKEREMRFRQKQSDPDSVFYSPNDPELVKERSQRLAAGIERQRQLQNAQQRQEATESAIERERTDFAQRHPKVRVFLDAVYFEPRAKWWVMELQEENGETGFLHATRLETLYELFTNESRRSLARRRAILPKAAVSALIGKNG